MQNKLVFSPWVYRWFLQVGSFGLAFLLLPKINFKMALAGALIWFIPQGYFLKKGRLIKKDLDHRQLLMYFWKQESLKWVVSIISLIFFSWQFRNSTDWLLGYISAILISLLIPIKRYD